MSNKLAIQTTASEDTLVGFPFADEQYYDGSEDDQSDDTIWLYIDLAGAEDVTTAQAQFLNTNPSIIEYQIVDK